MRQRKPCAASVRLAANPSSTSAQTACAIDIGIVAQSRTDRLGRRPRDRMTFDGPTVATRQHADAHDSNAGRPAVIE